MDTEREFISPFLGIPSYHGWSASLFENYSVDGNLNILVVLYLGYYLRSFSDYVISNELTTYSLAKLIKNNLISEELLTSEYKNMRVIEEKTYYRKEDNCKKNALKMI